MGQWQKKKARKRESLLQILLYYQRICCRKLGVSSTKSYYKIKGGRVQQGQNLPNILWQGYQKKSELKTQCYFWPPKSVPMNWLQVPLFQQFPTLGSVCKKDLYWLDLVSHFGHFCDTRKFSAWTWWPNKKRQRQKTESGGGSGLTKYVIIWRLVTT